MLDIAIYVLIALNAVLIVLLIVSLLNLKKVREAYKAFMRGHDGISLEGHIRECDAAIEKLIQEDRDNKEAIKALNKLSRGAYQKCGIVHYNAFKGMGGNLSFACALLDYTNSGYVINSVHSREGCYVYMKVVDCGQTEVLLGDEEKEALEQALGYNG